MLLLAAAAAVAAPSGVQLQEGETVVQPCLDDPDCEAFWDPQLSETMIEIGYALHHDPVLTSAFGAKGAGVVAELGVESVPLGKRDILQGLYPLVPAVPVLSVGYQAGADALDAPTPQVGAGVHLVPPLKLGGGTTWALGATASFAIPVGAGFWVGAEGEYTEAAMGVHLLPDLDTLNDIELLDPYFKRNGPECVEPCLDRLHQHAAAARVGVSFDPVPALFVYARGGVAVLSQRLVIALDESVWGWTPVVPELSTGLGGRVGDRWQVSLGAVTAFRPEAATTAKKPMTKLLFATGFRFGAARS